MEEVTGAIVARIELPDGYIFEEDNFLGGQRRIYNPETKRMFIITARTEIKYDIQEVKAKET